MDKKISNILGTNNKKCNKIELDNQILKEFLINNFNSGKEC